MTTFQTTLRYIPAEDPSERAESCVEESIQVVRGVGWVLRWAAAMLVLSMTTVLLLDFAYRLAAEQALVRAATAGIREAALPRATSRSVEQAIRRELQNRFSMGRDVNVALTTAGKPWRSLRSTNPSGELMISLSLPVAAALPHWLDAISPLLANEVITVRGNRAESRGDGNR